MNCTCPENMSSQEHSVECNLRTRLAEAEAKLEKIGSLKMDTEIAELQHKLKEAEEAIRKLGEESLRDREKLANVEKREDERTKRIYAIGLLCDKIPGLELGSCPEGQEPRDNLTRIRLALERLLPPDDGRCCPEMKPWMPHTHGEGSTPKE